MFLNFAVFAQIKPFEITGTITGIDSGLAEIFTGRNDTAFKMSENKSNIINGIFSFKGDLSYTSYAVLKLMTKEKTLYTPWFFVDAGKQKINLSTTHLELFGEDSVLSVMSSGKTQTEYNDNFKKLTASIKSRSDEWRITRDKLNKKFNFELPELISDSLSKVEEAIKKEEKKISVQYIRDNPTSIISLYEAKNLISKNYEPLCDTVYNSLDKKLLASDIGKKISENIKILKSLREGEVFPTLSIFDSSENKISFHPPVLKKYTFYDFWFNGCSWCLKQFPELIKINSKWQSKGFEIVSITVDDKRFEQQWKNIIAKNKITWLQLWDIGGVEAEKLLIARYPTSFLLDQSGKIVAKNLEPNELESFLELNLK